MEIILHRRNSVRELLDTPCEFGVEMDVRSWGEDLIVGHDPYVSGELLELWLSNYKNGTLIVNTKEEGLEERILALLARYGITSFFFLDQSFPYLLKYAKKGISKCAVRVSEYESVETALNLKGLVTWVWLDLFGNFPLSIDALNKLKDSGFKICLVSPELHRLDREIEVKELRTLMFQIDFNPDAVCTKRPDLWQP